MDDTSFQGWSESLAQQRQIRADELHSRVQEKGADFGARDFFEIALSSLDRIMAEWWRYEQNSTDSTVIGNPNDVVESKNSEMESVIDFELEAIERDRESMEGQGDWSPNELEAGKSEMHSFSDQLKRSYREKIEDLIVSPVRSTPVEEEQPAKGRSNRPMIPPMERTEVSHSSSSSSSGLGMLLMFVLGLAIGAGPSFYFWDQAKKEDVEAQRRVTQLNSEKKTVEDNLSMYQTTIYQLANGDLKSVPELQHQMEPIQRGYDSRRAEINREFLSDKQKLIKKIPAGDRLDRALEKLQANHEEALNALDADEKSKLEPYLKQIQVLKELTRR